MKKLAIVLAFLPLLSGGGLARSMLRLPAPPPTNLNWRAYEAFPPLYFDPASSVSSSVAVDSEGVAHIVRLIQHEDFRNNVQQYEIWYFNSRYESRGIGGFSKPVLVDVARPADNTSLTSLDIAVGPDDSVHLVWTRGQGQGDLLMYKVIQPDGSGTVHALNSSGVFDFHAHPQIAVDKEGNLHVLYHRQISGGGTGTNAIEELVYSEGIQGGPTYLSVDNSNPSNAGQPRFALKGNKLCAVWIESTTLNGVDGVDVFYSTRILEDQSGSWSGKSRLTTSGVDHSPDVDLDGDGNLYFAWSKVPKTPFPIPDPPSVWLSINGQAGSQVSVALPNSTDPPLGLGGGARVRVSGNDLHVFYAGFSHATRPLGPGGWRLEEPLRASNAVKIRQDYIADPVHNKIPSAPGEVAEFQGRFDLVDPQFYIRTFDTIPDGASWVPAFPGGSVNIVPLSGTFRYRLNLFSTKGVGPCASLGMTYNTKQSVASLSGPGWTMDHMMTITVGKENEDILLTLPSGAQLNFKLDPEAGYVLEGESFGFMATLKKLQKDWALTTDGGSEYQFDAAGKLAIVREPTGNYIKINYNQSGPHAGMPSEIVDMLGNGGPGRATKLFYGTGADIRHVVRIVDPDSREYHLTYAPTFIGYQLSSVIFAGIPEQPTYRFEYGTNGFMSKVITPMQSEYGIFYDSAGRVQRIEDPFEVYLLEPEELPAGVDKDQAGTSSQKAMFQVFYDDRRNLIPGNFHTRIRDRRGKDTIHVFDASKSFAVIELWDAVAIAQKEAQLANGPAPSIFPILRTFDGFGNIMTQRDRWGFETSYTYEARAANAPGVWLRNLLLTVTKPHPSDPLLTRLVEEFTYTQDDFGNVQSHKTYVDGVARTVSYDYDPVSGQLLSTLFPDVTLPDGITVQAGVSTQNVYAGPRRQLSRTINEEGRFTEYADFHPVHGLPRSVRRQGGAEADLSDYDVMGNVVRTRRPRGGVGNDFPGFTEYGLDGLYRVATITDPAGRVTTNTYDLESRLVSVLPPAGRATTTDYDARGIVRGGSTPDGFWTQVVDANGNVRRRSSLRGFVTNTDYDSLNRVVAVRAPGAGSAGGGGPKMETTWLHEGFASGERFSLETRIGPSTRVTKTVYDNLQRAIRVHASDGKTVTETFYDEQNQVVAAQVKFDDVLQTATLTFRDPRDRVFKVRVQDAPYQGTPAFFADTVTFYNKAGSVTQTVDPLGNPAGFSSAHKTKYLLDERERVVQVIDGTGTIVKENIWGDDDLLVEVRVPDPEKKTSDLVRSEVRTYTARKELRTVKNRSNNGLTYAYNALQGQVDTVTDAQGRVTQTTYDPFTQRVDEVIVAQGTPRERRTKSLWEAGLLKETRVWNPEDVAYTASYRYFYDQADRLERFEAPRVAAEIHRYTAFGEELELVAGSKTVTHGYNALGQRTSSDWTGAFAQQETRTYNGIGLVEQVANDGFSKTMSYDVWQGTPSFESFAVEGQLWKNQIHDSDRAKNYRFFFDSENGAHEWVYDGNNRVREIKYANQKVCEVFYTPGGLVDKTELSNASGQVIARTIHSYDGLGRKIRQETVEPSTGKVLAGFEWSYDTLDLVTSVEVRHLGVRGDFEYNERRELRKEIWSGNSGGQAAPPYANQTGPGSGPESVPSNEAQAQLQAGILPAGGVTKEYGYDPAGNRTFMEVDGLRSDYAYNSASQLVAENTPGVSRIDHEYDEWGNEEVRTTTPEGQSPATELYGYNYLNLLSAYESSPQAPLWEYAFWPTGERYSKTHQGSTADTEIYVPRFGDVATEYSSPTSPKNTYVQGTGIDSKCTRIDAGGTRRHYLGDSVGTVSVTLSDTATPLETSLKDVWGNQIAGATPSERYGFAHREHDRESGLVHMRARMYDPKLGRFTQTDPIVGNRPTDHYAYASNNPVSRVDPMGLQDFVEKTKAAIAERVKSGDIKPVMEQLPQATELPTPLRDRFGPLADRLEADRGKMGPSPFMRLEDRLRMKAIAGLRKGDDTAYREYLEYGRAHLQTAYGAGNILAGAAGAVPGFTIEAPPQTTMPPARGTRVPGQLIAGREFEEQQLQSLQLEKNTKVWRPSKEDIESAAFKVIVGKAKYTDTGEPVGTTFDSTKAGLLEIKGGSSPLESSYQLRLQTYYSLKVDPQPYTIRTTRPPNPKFGDWLRRWGVTVEEPQLRVKPVEGEK